MINDEPVTENESQVNLNYKRFFYVFSNISIGIERSTPSITKCLGGGEAAS